MYRGLHVNYLLFLSDFNESWISSTDFQKKKKKTNFTKNCTVEAELFHCYLSPFDGQTDGYNEANSRFSKFCEHV
jgi:hypothetical protein